MNRIWAGLFFAGGLGALLYIFTKLIAFKAFVVGVVIATNVLFLIAGMLAGAGQSSAALFEARTQLREWKEKFDAKVQEAKDAYDQGRGDGSKPPITVGRVVIPTDAHPPH
jgi:high-affinity Fe2+/Pb2+ permease